MIRIHIQYPLPYDKTLEETTSIVPLRQIVEYWNRKIDNDNISLDEIWIRFDTLKKRFQNQLFLINKLEKQFYFRFYGDIYEKMKGFMTKKQFPTNCYEDWLIFRGKLEGITPFIPITILNPYHRRLERFLILNVNSSWNKNGLERFRKYIKQGNQKFSFIRIIAKEISIDDTHNLKTLIIKELEKKGYHYPSKIKDQYRTWFQTVFKLKITKELTDEILEGIFWKHVEDLGGDAGFRNHAKDSPQKQKIFEIYNNNRSVLKLYTKRDPEPDNSFETEIYVCDKSVLMLKLWSWLIKEVNPKSDWWEEVKRIPATMICRKIQELKVKHSKPINITYNMMNAKRTQFKDTSDNLTIFYNESRNNGFNRFNAALIQDKNIRDSITRKTNELSDINSLDLSTQVVSEDRWGRISSGTSHLIGKADIITYEIGGSGGKQGAREVIQNKLIREIGSHKGCISARDYLLDFLKTIGHFDIKRGTGALKLQLEYIRKGYSVGGLTNISKKNNIVIISYWGKSKQEMQRWGDIIAAVILRKYQNGFFEDTLLKQKVKESLKHGKEALRGRKMDSVPEYFVKKIIGNTKIGETTYLKERFLEFLRNYSEFF